MNKEYEITIDVNKTMFGSTDGRFRQFSLSDVPLVLKWVDKRLGKLSDITVTLRPLPTFLACAIVAQLVLDPRVSEIRYGGPNQIVVPVYPIYPENEVTA